MGMKPVDPSETDRSHAAAHDARATGKHPPHIERVIAERQELAEKIEKLTEFTKAPNGPFAKLEDVDRVLLEDQLCCMEDYRLILDKRLSRAGVTA